MAVDPLVPADSVVVRWIELPQAGGRNTVPHGPLWSPDGARAVVQFIGEDHEDVWIAEVDLESATAEVLLPPSEKEDLSGDGEFEAFQLRGLGCLFVNVNFESMVLEASL